MNDKLSHTAYTPGSLERPDADVTHPAATAPSNPGIGGQQRPSTSKGGGAAKSGASSKGAGY